MFIHHVEEVKQGYYFQSSSKSPDVLIFSEFTSILVEYKLVAEVTCYSSALLEYKIHNLSLSSESRHDLQLKPKTIPSILVEPRHSYQFRLPVQFIVL
jgi:hypothetical protein